MSMNVAIVGCGLIGQKRAKALGPCSLVACADIDPQRAAALAKIAPGCEATADWRAAVRRKDVDIVIVATIHDALAEVCLEAVKAGKHVLLEKPGARRASELDEAAEVAVRNNVRVHVGFNHRYHPAIRKAKELVDSGVCGELMFLRGRYGHGGRPGYDKEWRAIPEKSGGGELLDQGSHLIDLSRMFLGDFTQVQGTIQTYFWDMPVEDNGFMLLETARKQVAFLHATWTEWKNLFSLEIYGRDAKLDISGLGGSYGVERLAFYRMLPEMGPPETTIWEFPQPDTSWSVEFAEFLEDIRLGRDCRPGLRDAQAMLTVVETIYRKSES